MLSNKSVSSRKLILVKNQKNLITDDGRDFLSNTIKTCDISKFDQVSHEFNDPTIFKHGKHLIILGIKKLQN